MLDTLSVDVDDGEDDADNGGEDDEDNGEDEGIGEPGRLKRVADC